LNGEDTLMGGRVRLLQGQDGYRAAIDPVLLAASVPATHRQQVLELGAGGGAAALCLGMRVAGVRITGIELQADLVDLARQSADLNGLGDRVIFRVGDVLAPPRDLIAGSFDHVMANPPYLSASSGHPPPDPAKAMANVEGAAVLVDWIDCAVAMVRDKGHLTFIHRADRIDEIIAALHGKLGAVTIVPLWPQPGKAAKRVIVQGRKGVASPSVMHPGIVLHGVDGGYTQAAEMVLKDGAALAL